MNKLQRLSIEWTVTLCLLTIVLWLPFISTVPQVIGIVVLGYVFRIIGYLAGEKLEEWVEDQDW